MVYIEDVARFGAEIGNPCLGVLHHRRDGRVNLDEAEFVAGGEHAFAIHVDDVIAHHLACLHLA